MNFSDSSTFFRGIGFTLALTMNLLGAPASRRPVGSRKPELAGETPVVAVLCPGKRALPETVPRFMAPMRAQTASDQSARSRKKISEPVMALV
jgi:hypothetical protein